MIIRWNRIRTLLIILGVAAAIGQATPTRAKDSPPMLAVNPNRLKFTPIPDMPRCATAAALRGDPRWGAAWVLLKLASGCRVPQHWHTPNEDVVVITGQGSLTMEDGQVLQFAPGAYATLPSHHTHRASCTRACLLFTSADGAYDIHYVDAHGEEISAEKALQQSATAKGKKK